MTVERVTRFYLGEFQTTLTKGGKYINQLDPEEEKALIRYACMQSNRLSFVCLLLPVLFALVLSSFENSVRL